MEDKNFKIVGSTLTCRSAFMTTPAGDVVEIFQKGYLVAMLSLKGDNGSEVQVPVDLIYSLKQEGESLLSDHRILNAIERFAFKVTGTTVDSEDVYLISGGTGYRLSTRLTKMVRRMLIGYSEVPVSWSYSNQLAAGYQKKKENGTVPKSATFLKMINQPHIRIGEWLRKITSI